MTRIRLLRAAGTAVAPGKCLLRDACAAISKRWPWRFPAIPQVYLPPPPMEMFSLARTRAMDGPSWFRVCRRSQKTGITCVSDEQSRATLGLDNGCVNRTGEVRAEGIKRKLIMK